MHYTASVICFDVAAKGFQVITELHSPPVIGWLRGTVAALGFLLVVPTSWGSRWRMLSVMNTLCNLTGYWSGSAQHSAGGKGEIEWEHLHNLIYMETMKGLGIDYMFWLCFSVFAFYMFQSYFNRLLFLFPPPSLHCFLYYVFWLQELVSKQSWCKYLKKSNYYFI